MLMKADVNRMGLERQHCWTIRNDGSLIAKARKLPVIHEAQTGGDIATMSLLPPSPAV